MKQFVLIVALLVVTACDRKQPETTKAEPAAEDAAANPLPRLDTPTDLPGDVKMPAATKAAIDAASAGSSAPFTNRLILEDSPYLKKHAHNPVNWFPWGDEAFQRAAAQNKPVLLSIGYATCHWCHVMQRESFEDVEIARVMNERYISIKVDREEHPDVDAIYLAAVRRLASNAGWPATIWLTPEREPFFAGTYFPPRGSESAFLELLTSQANAYADDPSAVRAKGAQLAKSLREEFERERSAEVNDVAQAMRRAFLTYERSYDSTHAGWGQRKFPMPSRLRFLLHYHRRSGDQSAATMVQSALNAMMFGGIHDHVAGGFHRYTVDPAWHVPHFEKMLYDNAQLALVYTDAGVAFDDPRYLAVARRTLDFIESSMRDEGGAYWSALDAETEGREGGTYVWTLAELEEAGVADEFRVVKHRGLPQGTGALNLPVGADAFPRAAAIEKLAAVRSARAQPAADTKVIAAWNGLALQALARLAFVTNDSNLLARATRLGAFLEREMWDGERLLRTWTHASGSGELATAGDYVFAIAGLVELFEATSDRRWLAFALDLQTALDRDHLDKTRGAYRRSRIDADLLVAEVPVTDGAMPGVNGQAYLNLLELHALTQDASFKSKAVSLQKSLGSYVNEEPANVPTLLVGHDFRTDRPREVVVSGPANDPLRQVLANTFVPSKVAVVGDPDSLQPSVDLVPWLAKKGPGPDGKARAFVCYETVCELPTSDPAAFRKQLEAVQRF